MVVNIQAIYPAVLPTLIELGTARLHCCLKVELCLKIDLFHADSVALI
jgi:hypothetical protein